MSNTFGTKFRLTSFGESHGVAVGGVIDGLPAGIAADEAFIQSELNRRRPGSIALGTPRSEADRLEILSGVFEGRSTGTPIGFLVRNTAHLSADYDHLREIYRPSHADYTYEAKYGIRDHRGGGRSSARETIARVVAGAFAKLVLHERGISIEAYTLRVGAIALAGNATDFDLSRLNDNSLRCPDSEVAQRMEQLLAQAKAEGDSMGGIVGCTIAGVPAGLGEPVFDKLHVRLGAAMLSINAAKGFDYGLGFELATMHGSEANDEFYLKDGKVATRTNRSGGIQGGISNGQDIYFRVAFKPIATIAKEQQTLNRAHEAVTLRAHGRHDPCVIPRALVVVEAMAAITLLDFLLITN